MGKVRIRKPRYTVHQLERMITSPDREFDKHPRFMRSMAEKAHAAYKAGILPESHDALVREFALMKRDQWRAEETREAEKPTTAENFRERFVAVKPVSEIMDENIAISGKAPDDMWLRNRTKCTPWNEYSELHGLALKRIPGFKQEGRQIDGNHYIWTRIGRNRIITNHFTSSISGRIPQEIVALHIPPPDHAIVFPHLGKTWEGAFKAKTPRDALRKVAEYEWWFYQANPAGRGGASIGDCMSATLRMSLGLPLDRGYAHRDFQALTLPLGKYVKMRTTQLMKLGR